MLQNLSTKIPLTGQTDSALKLLQQHEKYIESLQIILDGGVPDFTETTSLDSVLQNASVCVAGEGDKELRERVEEEDRFALKRSGPIVGGEVGFSFSPLSGFVSDSFDITRGHLGVDIVAAEGKLVPRLTMVL